MERISEALQPLAVSISGLELDPENARLHGTRNLEAISRSLARFGQQKPIVIDGQRIVAGNGTVLAARSLGWERIAAVQQSGLSAEELRAFAIADNKTAELAEWEYQHLSDILRDLPEDLRLDTGFADYEIAPLLATSWTPPPATDEALIELLSIKLTKEQYEVFSRAADRIRADGDGPGDASDGRIVELLAAEFLA